MIAPARTKRPALTIVFRAATILLVIASAVSLTGCRQPALRPNLPQIYTPPAAPGSGKPPVIFIPGMLGSRLVNSRTGEVIWPDLRVDGDEIALPISSPVLAQNTDEVVATEVLEEAKVSALIPEISIYGPLLEALERYGGYKRARFDAPPPGGDCDTLYLFPYDWRRDVVESARALGCMIEELKRRLGRPDLRFDIVSHSRGGLVARYYAMYGERDVLDAAVACPDWSGARNLNRVVLIATPNGGSMNSLRVLLKGFSAMSFARPFGAFPRKLSRKLPFARVGPRVTFTVPAIYQLLPPNGQARFFSADLIPLPVACPPPLSLRFSFIGGDCIPTLDGAVILNGASPRTIFSVAEVPGDQLSRRKAADLIFNPGDGTITRHSLFGRPPGAQPAVAVATSMRSTYVGTNLFCDSHNGLSHDRTMQDNLLTALLINR